jgi:rubrerythrin
MAKSVSQKNGRRTSHEPNHSRMVEFLSQMLAVEKGGVMLYEKALHELSDEALRDQLEEFLEQTKRHVELCEEMLEQAGGSADESSPAAEAAEKKAEGLMSVEVPGELVDFNNIENLVLAETKDNWNWERLADLRLHRLPNHYALKLPASIVARRMNHPLRPPQPNENQVV